MDKAQGSRPLDKAFPADPELLEQGLTEQKVNLEGVQEKMGWNLGEWVLATPSVRQGRQPKYIGSKDRAEELGVNLQGPV